MNGRIDAWCRANGPSSFDSIRVKLATLERPERVALLADLLRDLGEAVGQLAIQARVSARRRVG
jgi:hypothetical protein